jgi:hypothetical protein
LKIGFYLSPGNKKNCANSDGLINWLRQPGQLLNQPQKSMREKYNPLIKFCCTLTVPAAETQSIGLQADALLSWFLHAILTTLSCHDKSCHLLGLGTVKTHHRDPQLCSHLPGLAKTTPPRR